MGEEKQDLSRKVKKAGMKENKRDNLSTEFKCMKIVIKMTLASCSPTPFGTTQGKMSHMAVKGGVQQDGLPEDKCGRH